VSCRPGALGLIRRWFTKTSIILFLNKIDLFRAKLAISPLHNTFPDYTGGSNYDSACAFLLEKFVSLNKNPSKSIYAVGRLTSPRVMLISSTTPMQPTQERWVSSFLLSTT